MQERWLLANTNTTNMDEDVHFLWVTEPQNVVLISCRKYKWDEQVNGALGEELDEGQLTFNYNIPLLRLPRKKNILKNGKWKEGM